MKSFSLLIFSTLITVTLFAQESQNLGSDLEFTPPNNWVIAEDPTGRADVVIKKNNSRFSDNITINIVGNMPDSDVFAARDEIISILKSGYPNLEVSNIVRVQVIDNENDLSFEALITAGNREIWTMQFFFMHKGIAYNTTMTATIDQADELRVVFRSFIESIKAIGA